MNSSLVQPMKTRPYITEILLMGCKESNQTIFSIKTYVVGTQKNCLNEHPKHMYKLMDKKIITI